MARLRNTDDGAGVTGAGNSPSTDPKKKKTTTTVSELLFRQRLRETGFAFKICGPAAAQAALGEGVAICVEQTVGPCQSCHGALLGI